MRTNTKYAIRQVVLGLLFSIIVYGLVLLIIEFMNIIHEMMK